MVQEIARVLMEREDTCHRTCFSIQHDGNILDNFAELASIEGLKDGSVFRVVEGKECRYVERSLFSLQIFNKLYLSDIWLIHERLVVTQ